MAGAPEVIKCREIETCEIATSTELPEPTSAVRHACHPVVIASRICKPTKRAQLRICGNPSSHIEGRNPFRSNLGRCWSSGLARASSHDSVWHISCISGSRMCTKKEQTKMNSVAALDGARQTLEKLRHGGVRGKAGVLALRVK